MTAAWISAVKTPFFRFKEYRHRRPDPSFDWRFDSCAVVPEISARADSLKRDGIVLLPGYFSGDVLARMQSAFERLMRERVQPDPVKDALFAPNFLDFDASLLDAALDDSILELVARYFQKPFGLGRVHANRLLPTPEYRDHSYQWHHDARGRQIHLMILLNGVPSDGQRMKYLAGSHSRYYQYHRGRGHGSRFEKDVVRGDSLGSHVVEVVGPPGTVALFDSNGLHSGTRNASRARDSVIYYYVSWRHCWQWKLNYQRSDFERLPEAKKKVVTFNPHFQLI